MRVLYARRLQNLVKVKKLAGATTQAKHTLNLLALLKFWILICIPIHMAYPNNYLSSSLPHSLFVTHDDSSMITGTGQTCGPWPLSSLLAPQRL